MSSLTGPSALDTAAPANLLAAGAPSKPARSPLGHMVRALPSVWLATIVVLAFLSSLIARQSPITPSTDILLAPSRSHLMGTDELGRDVFARVAAGAGTSLKVAGLAVIIGLVVGGVLGVLAARPSPLRRRHDHARDGRSSRVPGHRARAAGQPAARASPCLRVDPDRGRDLTAHRKTSPQPAIDRAQARLRDGRAQHWCVPRAYPLVHVARNVAAPIGAYCLLLFADAMLFEAALSFVGVGIQPPTPSWGNMILEGQKLLFADALVGQRLPWSLPLSDGRIDQRDRRPLGRRVRPVAEAACMMTDLSSTSPPASAPGLGPIVQVQGLSVRFPTHYGTVAVIDDVSFELGRGETLGLVGESGSGKSLLAAAILGLLPPSARITGRILVNDIDVVSASEKELAPLRGAVAAPVFQDALVSLNPNRTIMKHFADVWRSARLEPKSAARPAAEEALRMAALSDIPRVLASYPHELSGGMRQRALIALALLRRPALLIADEPTTALDRAVEAEVLGTLRRLQRELGLSIILVSHDMDVVAHMCARIAVLYGGQLVRGRRDGRAPLECRTSVHRWSATRGPVTARPGAAAGDHRRRGAPPVRVRPRMQVPSTLRTRRT